MLQIQKHCSNQLEASANDIRDRGRVEQCLKDHVAEKKITETSNKQCFAVISTLYYHQVINESFILLLYGILSAGLTVTQISQKYTCHDADSNLAVFVIMQLILAVTAMQTFICSENQLFRNNSSYSQMREWLLFRIAAKGWIGTRSVQYTSNRIGLYEP